MLEYDGMCVFEKLSIVQSYGFLCMKSIRKKAVVIATSGGVVLLEVGSKKSGPDPRSCGQSQGSKLLKHLISFRPK